jgi:hypothetical protein
MCIPPNDAETNWPAELFEAHQEIGRLRAALAALEAANDALCALRTPEQYLSMIDSGQIDALEQLDEARRVARLLTPSNARLTGAEPVGGASELKR